MSEYFPFYDSYKKAISKLPDAERLAAYDAITNYGIYGVEPEDDDSIVSVIFSIAKPSIDKAKKNKTNGSIGGKKKKEAVVEVLVVEEESREVDAMEAGEVDLVSDDYKVEEPSVSEEVKHYNKDNNNNDNKNKDEYEYKDKNEYKDKDEKEKNKTVSGFVPPSWSDVSGYIFDKGLNVSADKFMEYYAANGWMVGKQPIKDWRMTLRNWDRNKIKNPVGKHAHMVYQPDFASVVLSFYCVPQHMQCMGYGLLLDGCSGQQ